MKKPLFLVFLGLLLSGTFFINFDTFANKEASKKYYVWVDFVMLRQGPGKTSPVIARLEQGAEVDYLSENSGLKEEMTLHGKRYSGPWLKVKTYQKTGWVFGGALREEDPVRKKCATAFPNQTGTQLVTTVGCNRNDGEKFKMVICPRGKVYPVDYIKKTDCKGGAALSDNFDGYGGYYYRINNETVRQNDSCLLVTADFLQQRKILAFQPLHNKKCAPTYLKEIERIKGWVVKDSWSLIKVAGKGEFYLVLFERQGKQALACITYVTPGKLVFMDLYGEDRESGTWRVDDGGEIAPDMFQFLAVLETKDGMEFVICGYGGEGVNIYYQQEMGNIFFPVLHDYRYTMQ